MIHSSSLLRGCHSLLRVALEEATVCAVRRLQYSEYSCCMWFVRGFVVRLRLFAFCIGRIWDLRFFEIVVCVPTKPTMKVTFV